MVLVAGLTATPEGSLSTESVAVTVGKSPFAVAVNPATNTVYAANRSGNSVSVIDGSTNTVTTTVTVGSKPRGVAVNPSTNTVYVSNEVANSVSVIR